MTHDFDAIVIGAGLVGVCTARSLRAEGLSVLLVDREEPGNGASFGNAGVISPWSIVPQFAPGLYKRIPGWLADPDGPVRIAPRYLPKLAPWGMKFLRNGNESRIREVADAMQILCAPSVDLYREHLAGSGSEQLLTDSYHVQAFRDPSEARLDTLDHQIRRDKGAEVVLISDTELRALEPAVSSEFKAAILIKGQARARSPKKICDVIAARAIAEGVVFRKEQVADLHSPSANSFIVSTDSGKYNSKSVVVAAGAWSARLLAKLGHKVPLVAERGYHLRFEQPGVEINNSVLDVERKVIASSMNEGLRIAGTTEFAEIEAPVNTQRFESIMRTAKRLLPDLNTTQAREWMGVRPSFPDGLPILGEFSRHPGLFGAFGHCHYGLMMAPMSGKLVAQQVARGQIDTDVSAFAADRFS